MMSIELPLRYLKALAPVGVLTLVALAGEADAQQVQRRDYHVGNAVGLPVAPPATDAPTPQTGFAPVSRNVRMYGALYSVESCVYDSGRGLILAPSRGVAQAVRTNDAWIALINHDGSVHTPRWIGIQNSGVDRDSLTPPLVFNEPFGSFLHDGELYFADRDGGTPDPANPNQAAPSVAVLRTFDLATGRPLKSITVAGSPGLNDIAVAADGTVYGTNTGNPDRAETWVIWKVAPSGQASVFVQGAPLNMPNGIEMDSNGNIVVVNIGSADVISFAPDGHVVRTEQAVQAGNDGLVIMPDGVKFVSSVRLGGISMIAPGAGAKLIAENIPSAASMCYDSGANQLVIPMNANNGLAFVSLNGIWSPAQQAPGPAAPAVAPTRTFPPSPRIEGQANESRPPEKADDKPEFPGQTRAPYRASVPVQSVTITDKLTRPWSVAPLPDGRYLVTEKGGAMRIVAKDGALSDPLSGVPAVLAAGQGGLLDVALDTQFRSNKRIFFTHTQARAEGTSGVAVARATLDERSKSLRDVTVIYAVQPDAPISQSAQQGSRIAVAQDGTLFVTIGDRSTRGPWLKAQDMTTALGKILHITADGKPARNNPFLNTPGVLPEIWSAGHRNPHGLAFDASGQLWEVEHGPQGGDELNRIEPGRNYGWPVIVHGIDYTGKAIGEGITAKAGLEQPLYYWDPVIAASGLAIYSGKLIPQWNGSVLISALRGQQISRLTLSDGKVVAEEPLFGAENTRFRDVRVDRDGAVLALTENGKLVRITPK